MKTAWLLPRGSSCHPSSCPSCYVHFALAIVLLTSLTGCTTSPSSTDAARMEACLPSFPDEDGWFGGDAAFSVPLNPSSTPGVAHPNPSKPRPEVSLWFFGDSFVARNTQASPSRGRVYPFVHNAVARSSCSESGEWQIDYAWDEGTKPQAFFKPDPNAPWVKRAIAEAGSAPYYWPLAPFVLEDVLYVGLLRVHPAVASGPFNLPFRLVGADLAQIQNPADPPEQWAVDILPLTDQGVAIPGSAWVAESDFVYAFTYINGAEGRTPQILTRLPQSALRRWPTDLARHIETLGLDGEWIPGLRPDHATRLMEDDATEMSVHYSPHAESWLAVYSDPTPASQQAQKGILWLRRAKTLAGPWSEPFRLAVVPEQRRGSHAAEDPTVFCYAGKAHPQFGAADELVMTYVCNLYARTEKEIPETLERLLENPGIYRPQVMRIKIPSPVKNEPEP